ncbi:MAG: hypothetical protein IH840_05515 [Candidatus Heimdallarchaeota archaeon]|nr:hypothetical protein [Candidatus Heimdallarchaeota archaeon]
MDEYDKLIRIIKSDEDVSEVQLRKAADDLIALVANKKYVSDKLIDSLVEIYATQDEMIKVRAVEIGLKLLDYSLYANDQVFGYKIIEFIRTHLKGATEKVLSALIIHHSWAHRKHSSAKDIVKAYDDLLTEFNHDTEFHALYLQINRAQAL